MPPTPTMGFLDCLVKFEGRGFCAIILGGNVCLARAFSMVTITVAVCHECKEHYCTECIDTHTCGTHVVC